MSDDDEMHMHATMLPAAGSDSERVAAQSSSSSSAPRASAAASSAPEVIAVDDDSDDDSGDSDAKTTATAPAPPAPRAPVRERVSSSPFATATSTPAPAPPQPAPALPVPSNAPKVHRVPVVLPSTNATPAGDDFIRVSEHCAATRCLRVQWEAEMNPRCPVKTTISNNGDVYIFDGFYLLYHGDLQAVPQFEYTRGGVMCKIQFVAEDTPSVFRMPPRSAASANGAVEASDARAAYCQTMFLLQRYIFSQLLRIQPVHLFHKTFPDLSRVTSDTSDICSDFHIVPRFIAVNQQPLLNRADLLAPHRIGFAVGNMLPLDQVLLHLEESAKFTAAAFLTQFDAHQLIDIVISTRINGTTPGAFRVDELVVREPASGPTDNGAGATASSTSDPHAVTTKDGRTVVAIKHRSDGAWNYDGAKTKKKIRKWQELGTFLQLSPQVDPLLTEFSLHECHLTGLRADIFEVASAMPMVLKHIRHCHLLTSFEATMGFTFNDKSLLRQAFTHGSYVDVGMQSVNTVEATFSRVHLGHVFENTASLKRSRSRLYDSGYGDAVSMDKEMQEIADKHLAASEFKEEFHSRFLCPYERLEFLGDAVLSFLVASSTFLKLPNADEGFLHQTRVDIVNNDNLGKIARTANFESLLLSAFDLAALKDETKSKIVADCFEALLGALYKDQGIVPCRALLGKLMSLHDDELRELFFLSTDEVAEKATVYVEIDRQAIQSWSKLTEARIRHRRFTATTKVEIKNTHLWLQCMTHNSFKAPQIPPDEFICSDPSYERIEFLGDAVLQLLSSAFLVDAFPYYQEHLLTQVRSSLVKNTRLAVIARSAGYEEFLRLGEHAKRESSNLYVEDVLADVFEATLGAVFLENYSDLGKVNAILERTVFPVVKEAIRRREWMNPRKVLSHHLTQWSAGVARPIDCKFKAIKRTSTSGKAHDQSHSVALYVNNFVVARASGRTIAAAQDAACNKALQLYSMKFTG